MLKEAITMERARKKEEEHSILPKGTLAPAPRKINLGNS